jgi:hypothetical protein
VIPTGDGKVVIAGKSNGDVVLFSTVDAEQIGVLYQHRAPIVSLAVVESRNRVVSADDWSRILVADFEVPLSKLATTPQVIKPSIVLDQRFEAAVTRMLASPSGNSVLMSSRHTDQLWKLPSGEVFAAGRPAGMISTSNLADTASSFPPGLVSPTTGTSMLGGDAKTSSGPISAFQHPTNPEWFVAVTRDIARVYSWEDFTELTSREGIRLVRKSSAETPDGTPSPPQTNLPWDKAALSHHVGPSFVIERFHASPSSPPRLYLWPATELDPASPSGVARAAVEPNLDAVGDAVFQVLCVSGPSTLLFLDVKLWVCSVELQSVAPTPPAAVSFPSPPRGFSTHSASTSTSSLASSAPRSMRSSTASTNVEPTAHAKRHFFALREWRTGNGELRCAVAVNPPVPGRGGRGARDIIAFAVRSRVVAVHGGLGFSESVVVAAGATGEYGGRGVPGQDLWRVVGGSMHCPSSNC